MLTVVTELANGNTDVFETEKYLISKVKFFHPLICKVTIYSNGKKIKSAKRHFIFFYKHFIFKSEKVQKILADLKKSEIEND